MEYPPLYAGAFGRIRFLFLGSFFFGKVDPATAFTNLPQTRLVAFTEAVEIGAMPAEYGNALSGAFDMKMRVGNNANHTGGITGRRVGPERLLVKPKELGWWPDAYLSFPFGWHADLQRHLYRHLSEAGD